MHVKRSKYLTMWILRAVTVSLGFALLLPAFAIGGDALPKNHLIFKLPSLSPRHAPFIEEWERLVVVPGPWPKHSFALETFDTQVYTGAGFVSGHTLKHIVAGLAGGFILLMLWHRQARRNGVIASNIVYQAG